MEEEHLWDEFCRLRTDMHLWLKSNKEMKNEMKARLKSLSHENTRLKKRLSELTSAKGGESLSLAEILDYAEHIPPEQFERAKVMKEAIRDLFHIFTPEESERVRRIGTSGRSFSLTVNGPLNDIHDNNLVKATV